MAKKLNTDQTTELANPMVEIFGINGETSKECFGGSDKIEFTLNGDGFAVDFTKAVPKLEGFDSRVRKPLMRYNAKYVIIPDDQPSIEMTVHRGKARILSIVVSDKKKYKSTVKEVMMAILEDAGSQARYYVELASQSIVNDFKTLEKAGKLSGIFHNIMEIGYHGCPGVSKSQLAPIAKSFNHFKFNLENPLNQTESMKLGSMVHLKVLEPKRYKKSVIVMDLDKRTTEGKIQSLLNEVIHAGKTVISSEQEAKILVMERNLLSHPVIPHIFKESKFEVSMFWENDLGFLSRGRVDGLIESPSNSLASLLSECLPYSYEEILESAIVWDVKTADDADEREFSRACLKRGYHIQAASYSSGMEKLLGKKVIFIFILVENKAPYQVDFQVLDPSDVGLGFDTYMKLLTKLESHNKNPKLWSGYAIQKKRFLQLPSYAHYEVEDNTGNQEG